MAPIIQKTILSLVFPVLASVAVGGALGGLVGWVWRRHRITSRVQRLGGDVGGNPVHVVPDRSALHPGAPADGSRRPSARPQPMQVEPVVSVRALTKRYGDVTAVDDLNFSLQPGTVTGFIGPNGAGKSTTLRLLLGLARPTAGEARLFGRRYHELDRPANRVGAVLESGDFHPARSGCDHLRTLAMAAGLAPGRVAEVLAFVGLTAAADRRVGTYSMGMRQRLGLAAALLGDPELLILDEPANGLDPAGMHWLRTFIGRFAEGGGTVLISSHVLAEIAQTVDRILIIFRGRLLAAEALDELAGDQAALEAAYLELTGGAAS